MQVSLTNAVTAVEFQQPLGESEIVQDSLLLTLPLEILEQIGRACADGQTAIAYTRSCRCLYALRPKILTTDLEKLSWTLQKLLSCTNKFFLTSFLGHCKSSPFIKASFMLFASDEDQKKQVEAVFPNVRVMFERPGILDDRAIFRHFLEEQERPRLRGIRIQDVLERMIVREPPRALDDFMRNYNQPRIINILPQPPVLNLTQMVHIQQEIQRLERQQLQINPIADAVNQIQNFIYRLF